ncbi:MAG: hypothetical protein HY719_15560 [Planctomycetes bacterium]|nr:hypothetical protein [Planctomycetota bacterium]
MSNSSPLHQWLCRAATLAAVLAAAVISSDTAFSVDTTPQKINFQGRLTDASGNPASGAKDIIFRYYSASSGGTLLYAESRSAAGANPVTVTQGNYAVELGGGTLVSGESPLYSDLKSAIKNNAAVWLEVNVIGEAVMTPRIHVLAAAYAIDAEFLDGQDGTYYLDSSNQNAGSLPVARLPSDGYGSTYVNATGDTMSGALTVAGTIQSTSGGVKFPDGSTQLFSGKVINMTVYQNSTRTGMSSPGSVMASFTVDKKSSTSKMLCQSVISGYSSYSGGSGQRWQYGAGAAVDAQSTTYIPSYGVGAPSLAVIAGHTTTGPQTMQFSITGPYHPFAVWNPNSADYAGYTVQTMSVWVVWEVEP